MVAHTCDPVLGRLSQEDCGFEISLSYIIRSCLKNKKQSLTVYWKYIYGNLTWNPVLCKIICTNIIEKSQFSVLCLGRIDRAHTYYFFTDKHPIFLLLCFIFLFFCLLPHDRVLIFVYIHLCFYILHPYANDPISMTVMNKLILT